MCFVISIWLVSGQALKNSKVNSEGEKIRKDYTYWGHREEFGKETSAWGGESLHFQTKNSATLRRVEEGIHLPLWGPW